MNRRRSGLLLHITSLPSRFGIGDLGEQAYRFVDFLAEAGQSVWQILPLSPTALTAYNDPYHSISAFAGNPLLISPALLVRDGLLTPAEIEGVPDFPAGRVDFEQVTAFKAELFAKACERFDPTSEPGYGLFCDTHGRWLHEMALFAALKEKFAAQPWYAWPANLRDRDPSALAEATDELRDEINRAMFLQYLFAKQWEELHGYCRARGIQVFGDLPIYVDHDSVDVWTKPELWKLDDQHQPRVVAGVPPDYFSATGQLWLSPIYDWDAHRDQEFDWWLRRVGRNLELYDLLRIDHFRGLVAFWEVPAGEETAINGRWTAAPVEDFFEHLTRRFPGAQLVAEDLGFITAEVREVKARYGLPGMKILQFGFGGDVGANPDAPHNYERDCWAYTGTHDNNPVLGWLAEEADEGCQQQLAAYLGRELVPAELPWEMIRLVMSSAADSAVTPVQDLLGLGAEARMNRPGSLIGNWHWRLEPNQLTAEVKERLLGMTRLFGRD